ncbi:structural toxin protein [Colletotrichum kahawae]|uniref:ATP phosphoribosyltransferase n=1 Tax=Colletotrichum kahawae TaxID=34407 RepID=A0AAD9YJM8_COLKA|nr:structural toxin protein [Colletotrichum kahawae]
MPIRSPALGVVLRGNCMVRHPHVLPLSCTGIRPLFSNKIRLAISHHRQITTTPNMTERYKLYWTVPASHLVATKEAVFKTGAGVYDEGKYVQVAFQITGQGQFMPVAAAGADPHTGTVDELEQVLEYKVEIVCVGRDVTKAAVAALKSAHPYEVPAYEVYKLEDF